MFKGILTATITPLREGKVDEPALRRFVDWQIKGGIHGIVPCGTTGESATLSYEEHERVVDIVIEHAAGRTPVLAGSGSNSTWETIKLTRHARNAGAKAALLITPYYNRPTQEGLYQHFKAVAAAVDLPLVLYNVPSRTGVNLMPETMGRLARIENIVGLKDAAGNIKQTLDTILACEGNAEILSGDDFANLAILAVGGVGAISVTANVAPGLVAESYNAWARGDLDRARQLQQMLHPLNNCMFLETNPIPVKWAAHRLGLCSDEIRLPLTPLDEKLRPKLEAAMADLGLGA
jgi:4-hydroxy-tetrahydrodipicolinate synthase